MATRTIVDVSELPHHEFDTYDPVWWGNNLLLAIESSMFAILIATYFYLRQNFSLWPPPLASLSRILVFIIRIGEEPAGERDTGKDRAK